MARKKQVENLKEITLKDTDSGMLVRVHQSIKDVNPKGEEKERIQIFEGLVVRRKGGNQPGGTVTVRKVAEGVGVEKIYPVYVPSVKKVELVKTYKVRRANILPLVHSKKRLTEILPA